MVEDYVKEMDALCANRTNINIPLAPAVSAAGGFLKSAAQPPIPVPCS